MRGVHPIDAFRWLVGAAVGGTLLLETAASAARPTLDSLLKAYPKRGQITCGVRETCAPVRMDLEKKMEKIRRQGLRNHLRPAELENQLSSFRATWVKVAAGTDQQFQRVYYWKPDGLRLGEKGHYLSTGAPYVLDDYQYGPDSCSINSKDGAAQLFPNEKIRRGLHLEQVLLWGISPKEVIDLSRARISHQGGKTVVRGPVTADYKKNHFPNRRGEVEMTFGDSPIPVAITLYSDGIVAEKAVATGMKKVSGILYPQQIVIDSPRPPHSRKTFSIRQVQFGQSVVDAEFVPVVKKKTVVLDGRHNHTVGLILKPGEKIPDSSVTLKMLGKSAGMGMPPEPLGASGWLRVVALLVAAFGAWLLLRKPKLAV
jgi:hypothetical protein